MAGVWVFSDLFSLNCTLGAIFFFLHLSLGFACGYDNLTLRIRSSVATVLGSCFMVGVYINGSEMCCILHFYHVLHVG